MEEASLIANRRLGERMNWLFNHQFQPQPQYLTFTFCQSLVCWVTTNDKPLALDTFRYLEAEERRTRWKKEYGTVWYSTAHHTVRSQKAHFSGIFQDQKIVVKLTGPRYFQRRQFHRTETGSARRHIGQPPSSQFFLRFQLVITVVTQHLLE